MSPACLDAEPYRKAIILICSAQSDRIKDKLLKKGILEGQIHIPVIRPGIVSVGMYMQYYDIFQPLKEEVFIDAGAYDGTTVDTFRIWTGGLYKKVLCLEPFHEMADMLKKKFSSDSRIEIHEVAAWDENTNLSFAIEGSGSKISENGTLPVRGERIDDIAPEGVTMIKMDIEGSELRALMGAAKTICRDKPRLAICLYHKKKVPMFETQIKME